MYSKIQINQLQHTFVALLWNCEFNCVILLSFFLISYSLIIGLYLFSFIRLGPGHDNNKLVNIWFIWAWFVSEELDASLREQQYFPKFLQHLLHRSMFFSEPLGDYHSINWWRIIGVWKNRNIFTGYFKL